MKNWINTTCRLIFFSTLLTVSHAYAIDSDNDGIDDSVDNCPTVANQGQFKISGHTLGMACDPAYLSNPAKNDYNGDGYPDLLWITNDALYPNSNAHANQNNVVLWRMAYDPSGINPPTHVETTLPGLSFPRQFEGHGDFNGDGVQDIVYTNGDQLHVVLMDNGHILKDNDVGDIALADRQIVIGDFDGDGDSDFLIRDRSTGEMYTITMQNGLMVNTHKLPAQSVNIPNHFSDYTVSSMYVLGIPDKNLSGVSAAALADNANAANSSTIPFIRQGNTYTYLLMMRLNKNLSDYTLTYKADSFLTGTFTPIMSIDTTGDGVSDLIMQKPNGDINLWILAKTTDGTKLVSNHTGAYQSLPYPSNEFRANLGKTPISASSVAAGVPANSESFTASDILNSTDYLYETKFINGNRSTIGQQVASTPNAKGKNWKELSECSQVNGCKTRSTKYFGYYLLGNLCAVPYSNPAQLEPLGTSCLDNAMGHSNIGHLRAEVQWDRIYSMEDVAASLNAQLATYKARNLRAMVDLGAVLFKAHGQGATEVPHAGEELQDDYVARWQYFLDHVYAQYSEQIVAVVPRDEPYSAPAICTNNCSVGDNGYSPYESLIYPPSATLRPLGIARIIKIQKTLHDVGYMIHNTEVTPGTEVSPGVPFGPAFTKASRIKVAINDMLPAYSVIDSASELSSLKVTSPYDSSVYSSNIYPADIDWISTYRYESSFATQTQPMFENTLIPHKWPNQRLWLIPTAFSSAGGNGGAVSSCMGVSTPSTTAIGNDLINVVLPWAKTHDVIAVVPFLWSELYCSVSDIVTPASLINAGLTNDPMLVNLKAMGTDISK